MREKPCRDCVATVSRPCRDCVATVSRLYCDDSITKHRGVNKHDTHVRPFYLPLAFPFLYFCVFPLPLPLIMFIIIRGNTPAGVPSLLSSPCLSLSLLLCLPSSPTSHHVHYNQREHTSWGTVRGTVYAPLCRRYSFQLQILRPSSPSSPQI